MQSEMDYLNNITSSEETKKAYEFFMRTDPNQREFLGPIEKIDDPVTGRKMRIRDAKVGMVRGAKSENMKQVKVYLDPLPHIRLEKGKDLQGWYANKIAGQGQRPRPCMTDAMLTEPYGGFCSVGCAFSLPPGEMIDTPRGPRAIETIREGEFVWGRSREGTVPAVVTGRTKHWKEEGYIILRLDDGRELRLTADHPVYSVTRATWVAAGDLRKGEELEDLRGSTSNPRVEEIERVDGGLHVYDIETTTENFYQNGILNHNCYVNSGFRGYRGSGLISVPIGYGEHVRKQLASMQTAAAGYFSSFTDPFLPLEDFYHNTQEGASAFVNAGLPIFFLSRLRYPDWAIDLLRQNSYSYAQKSINTPDPDDWKKLSPGALPLMEHLEDIRRLKEAGIYVSIQVNPILPGIVTHDDVERLFGMLAEAGTNHVIVKFVEAGYAWAGAMVERVNKRFGDNRGALFRELFTENQCGAQRTIDREYRLEGHRRYQRRARELGMTYATCYEFDKGADGSWRSIGGDFLTADQCHGHRVPMFQRNRDSLRTWFSPMEVCPPSGCLTCADKTGKPACGSDLLGSAKALRLADLRKDPWANNSNASLTSSVS